MCTEKEIKKNIDAVIIKMKIVYATKCANQKEAENLLNLTKEKLYDEFGLNVED